MAKILCIDDDIDVLETCKLLLTDEGHDVDTAMSAKEGLIKMNNCKPDLVLLDVMMENLSAGFHFSYNIRQDEKLKYTPILMLTSINQTSELKFDPNKDGEFLPVDELVEKPIIREKLINIVDKLLRLPKEQINIEGRKIG